MSDNAELAELQRRYDALVQRSGQRDPEFERLLANAKEARARADAWAAYVQAPAAGECAALPAGGALMNAR
jgi:hypothetical protein